MKNFYLKDSKFYEEKSTINKLNDNQVRISIKNCGICGSDIHYYLYGENGGRKILEPLMLGHEFSGKIIELGSKVFKFNLGDRVAVNPALPCGDCDCCKKHKSNLCDNGSFLGSAAKIPHTQGAFRELIDVSETQCFNIEDSTSFEQAAFAEPLAVALHACSLIKDLVNKKIIISGCGPIGLLILKVLMNKLNLDNIFVLDINNNVLSAAKKMGFNNIININLKKDFLKEHENYFDIAFESSGSLNSINNIINLLSKSGQLIQVGNMPGGLIGIEYNKLMLKELSFKGSSRFDNEFEEAVKSLNSKLYNCDDMLTHKFKLKDCDQALKVASNKNLSLKVQVFN